MSTRLDLGLAAFTAVAALAGGVIGGYSAVRGADAVADKQRAAQLADRAFDLKRGSYEAMLTTMTKMISAEVNIDDDPAVSARALGAFANECILNSTRVGLYGSSSSARLADDFCTLRLARQAYLHALAAQGRSTTGVAGNDRLVSVFVSFQKTAKAELGS